MKVPQYIALGVALVLIAFLYRGNTVPPAKPQVTGPMQGGAPQGPNTMKAASFDSLLTEAKSQLPKTAADSVNAIENERTASRDSSQLAVVYNKLAGIYRRNRQLPIAAFYMGRAGKLENSGKTLTFAGQLFLELMQNERSSAVQIWEAREAAGLLEKAVTIQPDSETSQLALATAYIEGTGEPMKGVQILRQITAKRPDDIPANMLLGRMSIQSGQYDKAVKRFETVLKADPDNTEAVYFLAETYEGLGDKPKAIEMLEKVKKMVNKPEFSKEIDQHISTLK